MRGPLLRRNDIKYLIFLFQLRIDRGFLRSLQFWCLRPILRVMLTRLGISINIHRIDFLWAILDPEQND